MTQADGHTPARAIEDAFNQYLTQRALARGRARHRLLALIDRREPDRALDNPIDFVAREERLSSEEVHLALASLLNDEEIAVTNEYRLVRPGEENRDAG